MNIRLLVVTKNENLLIMWRQLFQKNNIIDNYSYSSNDAIIFFQAFKPDIVLVEMEWGQYETPGIELIKSLIEYHDAKIIGMSMAFDETIEQQLKSSGAFGYLPRTKADKIIDCIMTVHGGQKYFPPNDEKNLSIENIKL